MPHLFVDVSSHGFGHLAQVAPILNALHESLPALRLTLRSGLPEEKLRARLNFEFTHIAARSDFGFVMRDAVDIDAPATAAAYREFHADWAQRVAAEAAFLTELDPDLVLTDVAYLPLAGAASAAIPSLSMCSLNWADLFWHVFGKEAWAAPIHAQILTAYRTAKCFLRLTPAMPMIDLPSRQAISPVAALGADCRAELRAQLALSPSERLILVAFGGFDKDLSAASWPVTTGLHWLVPAAWAQQRPDMTAIETTLEALAVSFVDLVASADAVLTKPGYGTFAEAACNGTPVLYLRRPDWPEQDCLIDWLQTHGRCAEIDASRLRAGLLAPTLEALWRQASFPAPLPTGSVEAALLIKSCLLPDSAN